MIAVRRIRIATLAAGLALGLAGCGDNGGSGTTSAANPPPPSVETGGSSSDQLSQAASATTGAGTYKTTFEVAMEGPSGPVTLAGTGEFQADPTLGKVTVETSGLTGREASGDAVVIFDIPTMYMQLPGFGDAAGATWIKFDIDAETSGLGQFALISQTDPAQTLQFLRGATGDVEEAGTETIRDVETTKYTMTLDLNNAADQLEDEEAKQALLDSIKKTGVSEVPAEVWIDDEGRVRRMTTHYTNSASPLGQTDSTITVEIYDFGADVNIDVPSDDEVLDFDLGNLLPTTTVQQ